VESSGKRANLPVSSTAIPSLSFVCIITFSNAGTSDPDEWISAIPEQREQVVF
jgi:hypothetical protein